MSQSRQESSAQEAKKNPTVMQSVGIGSVAGTVEVLVNHPLWTIKTRMQRHYPFTLNLSVLYKGVFPNAMSMAPTTAMQVGLNQALLKVFFNHKTELTSLQQVMVAFIAGGGSALVSCPTEMVLTLQGSAECSFYSAYGRIMKEGGFKSLYTALPMTVLRDGKFTAFFLGVTPILKNKIIPYVDDNFAASLLAGMTAGVSATVLSQPFDTIKTVQQSAQPSQPIRFKNAVTTIYKNDGVFGFFKGGLPRGGRVVSGVTIMTLVKDEMKARLNLK